jgi:hypothetical protein
MRTRDTVAQPAPFRQVVHIRLFFLWTSGRRHLADPDRSTLMRLRSIRRGLMVENVPRDFAARAEEIRTIAEGMRYEGARRLLLQLADGYEKMDADRRTRRESDSEPHER